MKESVTEDSKATDFVPILKNYELHHLMKQISVRSILGCITKK